MTNDFDFTSVTNLCNGADYTVTFTVTDDYGVSITIYDVSGKVYKTITGLYNAGEHSESISDEGLPSNGVFNYKIVAGDFEDVNTMIKDENAQLFLVVGHFLSYYSN